jgi:hypothetical protein
VSEEYARELGVVLRAGGIVAEGADSLVDALLDWIDADDVVRPRGAERAWYLASHRPTPRNGPLVAFEELRRVRGFERVGGLDSLLGVERDRIVIARAPMAVVAALPGMGAEVLSRLSELRSSRGPVPDLLSLAASLTPPARVLLMAHYAELVQRISDSPESWTVVSRASAGTPVLPATLELRIVNAGARAAIVRRRSWP